MKIVCHIWVILTLALQLGYDALLVNLQLQVLELNRQICVLRNMSQDHGQLTTCVFESKGSTKSLLISASSSSLCKDLFLLLACFRSLPGGGPEKGFCSVLLRTWSRSYMAYRLRLRFHTTLVFAWQSILD